MAKKKKSELVSQRIDSVPVAAAVASCGTTSNPGVRSTFYTIFWYILFARPVWVDLTCTVDPMLSRLTQYICYIASDPSTRAVTMCCVCSRCPNSPTRTVTVRCVCSTCPNPPTHTVAVRCGCSTWPNPPTHTIAVCCVFSISPNAPTSHSLTTSLPSQPVDLSHPLAWAPGHSLPWWQSSYVNHAGDQTVKQFVSPHPPTVSQPFPNPTPTFRIRLIEGNISMCYGCRNKYQKNSQPPNNLCLQTKEWREFILAVQSHQLLHTSHNVVRPNQLPWLTSCISALWEGVSFSMSQTDDEWFNTPSTSIDVRRSNILPDTLREMKKPRWNCTKLIKISDAYVFTMKFYTNERFRLLDKRP